MFHEVKIFDKTGKVKKVFPSKKLSKEYWNTFFEMGKPTKNKGKKGRKKEPGENFVQIYFKLKYNFDSIK